MQPVRDQPKEIISASARTGTIEVGEDRFLDHPPSISSRNAPRTSGILSANFWLAARLSNDVYETTETSSRPSPP